MCVVWPYTCPCYLAVKQYFVVNALEAIVFVGVNLLMVNIKLQSFYAVSSKNLFLTAVFLSDTLFRDSC